MSEPPLSDEQAALVFRRASELDAELAERDRSGEWDVDRLEAVAREVGITPEAVRRAVAEVRVGAVDDADLAGAGAGRAAVRRSRVVPAAPGEAQASLDDWFRAQLLDPVRERPGAASYRRRTDADAVGRRRRDGRGRYRLGAVDRVDVVVAPAPPPEAGAAVRLTAVLVPTRRRVSLRRAATGVPATGAGAVVVAAATPVGLAEVALAAPAALAGVGAWSWWSAGRHVDGVEDAVGVALDAALDLLER